MFTREAASTCRRQENTRSGRILRPSQHSEVHLAIGTVLSTDEVIALAQHEGWLAQRSPRGGLFDVVELWVENKFLLEVLPKSEQQRYMENLSADKFRQRFGIEEDTR